MERLSIGERINEVRKVVDYIKKTKKVQNYKGVEHDFVTATVRPELIKHGILTIVKEVEGNLLPTGRATSSGNPITTYLGKFEIDFCCTDKVEEKVTAVISGAGDDYGDKGPGKATTYALKMAILKTFNIETGESDESRIESEPVPATEKQIADIEAIRTEKGIKVEDFATRLHKKYGVTTADKLTETQANELINLLGAVKPTGMLGD